MQLREQLEKQGRWLFKGRSYLPLIALPLVFLALGEPYKLEQMIGAAAINYWNGFCIIISFLGLIIRGVTVGYAPAGTSGRTTDRPEAARLNTSGMYSMIRHPLYLGNFLIILGITLFVQVWWLALITILAFWLYYERIMLAEEEFLRTEFGDSFREWTEKTPAFIIRLKDWKKPDLSFSIKNVLKREYAGFFVIVTSFTFLKILGDIFTKGALIINSRWIFAFIAGLFIFLILRTLKKKTKLLDVEGR